MQDILSGALSSSTNAQNVGAIGTTILTKEAAGATVASSSIINGTFFTDAVRGGALYNTAPSIKVAKAIRKIGVVAGVRANSLLRNDFNEVYIDAASWNASFSNAYSYS